MCIFYWCSHVIGASWIEKVQRKKEKHIKAKQVMNELIQSTSLYKYDYTGPCHHADGRGNINSNTENGTSVKRTDSPILIAARMGVTEMIEKILDLYPVAIHDVDSQNKNVVLLAIENRQPRVYCLLNKMNLIKERAFSQVDNHGSSALHLAATYREFRPWRVPGAAMQMQWEYKWYKVKILYFYPCKNFRKIKLIMFVFFSLLRAPCHLISMNVITRMEKQQSRCSLIHINNLQKKEVNG